MPRYVDSADFAQLQALNFVFQSVGGSPASPVPGQTWLNTAGNPWPAPYYYCNSTKGARPLDAALLTDGSIQNSALAVNPLNRQNHFGTQPSSTISDLASTVQSYSLDKFAAAVATVNLGSQRLTALGNATQSTDAVPLQQLQMIVAAAVQGQTAIKIPARLAATTSINLANPGTSTFDSVTANAGDRILVPTQSTNTQNNVYVFNGSASAMTVASDCASGSQWTEGTEILVTEGSTYGGAIFRQTTGGTIVLGSNPLVFTQAFKINTYVGDGTTVVANTPFVFSVKYDTTMSVASGSLGINPAVVSRHYSQTLTGDGSTTVFTVTHNLATTDVGVFLRDSAGNKVIADDQTTSANALTVSFYNPPASNVQYRVGVVCL